MMSAPKHFINDATLLVTSALRGVTYANPSLAIDEDNKVVFCKKAVRRVALVSGGGAGHEPAFTSFVGDGLLRAAISGTIFASPSVKQIYNCITRMVNPNTGVLVIVMNYTGDMLHFGLATEKAKATGLNVDMVVVGDDVGVGREKSGKVGRRGIAGTALVQKIAGALAASGVSLKETTRVAKLVAANLVSVGSSLEHVHVPGHSITREEHSLQSDELELGMGIHNEQGSKRINIPELPLLVEIMLRQLLDKTDLDRNYLEEAESEGWVLLVNNLGGLSELELSGITAEVVEQLSKIFCIEPKRVYSGAFVTSLNGNGFMITLLRTVNTGIRKSMIELLDAPHETLGWKSAVSPLTWENKAKVDATIQIQSDPISPSNLEVNQQELSMILSRALKKLIENEPEISRYDSIVGDGDCGEALKRGAEAILTFIDEDLVSSDAVIAVSHLAGIVEESVGGTSGAIISIFLNSLAQALRETTSSTADIATWGAAAVAALTGLGKYTTAQPGDRTLVDALQPFVMKLVETNDLKAAARSARLGAESTRGMKAKLGRTVYIADIGDIPDPGAIGVAYVAEGMAGL